MPVDEPPPALDLRFPRGVLLHAGVRRMTFLGAAVGAGVGAGAYLSLAGHYAWAARWAVVSLTADGGGRFFTLLGLITLFPGLLLGLFAGYRIACRYYARRG